MRFFDATAASPFVAALPVLTLAAAGERVADGGNAWADEGVEANASGSH
jgi:hypothetical protein